MPRTDNLPNTWYDTHNIHFCTIKDFSRSVTKVGAQDGARRGAELLGHAAALPAPWWFWNLFGEQAVFLLSRTKKS